MESIRFRSLDHKLETIHSVMYDSPGHFYIKDLAGKYLYVNKNQHIDAGHNSYQGMLGRTDFDTIWGVYAPPMCTNDRTVIANHEYITINEVSLDVDGRVSVMVSHKEPFYHNNDLIGIRGLSMEIPTSVAHADVPYSDSLAFVDQSRYVELRLTKKQKEILYWTLKGYSSRETASVSKLSHRTVEHHLFMIKDGNEYASVKEILLNVRFA